MYKQGELLVVIKLWTVVRSDPGNLFGTLKHIYLIHQRPNMTHTFIFNRVLEIVWFWARPCIDIIDI